MAKRSASLAEPIPNSLEGRLDRQTRGDADRQQVQKIREIQPVLGELRRLTAREIGVRPKDADSRQRPPRASTKFKVERSRMSNALQAKTMSGAAMTAQTRART